MLELQREPYPEVRLVLVEIQQSFAVTAAELGKNGRQEGSLVAQPVRQVELQIVVLELVGRIYQSRDVKAVFKGLVCSPQVTESPSLEKMRKTWYMFVVAVPELSS